MCSLLSPGKTKEVPVVVKDVLYAEGLQLRSRYVGSVTSLRPSTTFIFHPFSLSLMPFQSMWYDGTCHGLMIS